MIVPSLFLRPRGLLGCGAILVAMFGFQPRYASAQAVSTSRLGVAQEVLQRVSPEQRQKIEQMLPGMSDANLAKLQRALLDFDKNSTLWNSIRSASTSVLSGTGALAGWFAGGAAASYASGFLAAVGMQLGAAAVGATAGAGVAAWMHYKVWKPRAEKALNAVLEDLERASPHSPAPTADRPAVNVVSAPQPTSQPSRHTSWFPFRTRATPVANTAVASAGGAHHPDDAPVSLLGQMAGNHTATP